MNDHGLTKENLVKMFPVALRQDPSMAALAEAVAELLAQRPDEIDRLRIYPAIDRLDNELLDILAHDFKVDWWDPDYSVEEKRRMLKGSWRVHRMLGTKAAVEMAISAIYPHSKVSEWFEYGGEPHHFRAAVNVTGKVMSFNENEKMTRLIDSTKRLTSWMDEIKYTMQAKDPAHFRLGTAAGVFVRFPIPQQSDSFHFRGNIHTGTGMGAVVTMPVPEQKDAFRFRNTVRTGAGAGISVRMPVPAQMDKFLFRRAIRTAAKAGAAARIPIPQQKEK